MYFATFLSTYTNAPKKKRFETSIKSNMGMHVMCQILSDAADRILKVVYCTRLASDVLITKVNLTDILPPSDAKLDIWKNL